MADVFPRVLTFDELLRKTRFVADMREMLETLQEAYNYPVDVEFTANFRNHHEYRIDLVQCRPFQVRGGGVIADPPHDLAREDVILRAHGAVIGQSRIETIDRLIFVSPAVYGQMPVNDRYSIARLIGRIMRANETAKPKTVFLLGPGRWGTTTPSLGVPVSFAEINTVSIICEIVAMREDLAPDVSLGTHFFSDMVELDMLYLALFPDKEGNLLNEAYFMSQPNRLADLVPGGAQWSEAVRVIDLPRGANDRRLTLNANTLKQRVVCYLGDGEA